MHARDDSYRKLLDLLTRLFGEALMNHSISASAALRLMSSGPQALQQEKELQERHLEICSAQIEKERAKSQYLTEYVESIGFQMAHIKKVMEAPKRVPDQKKKLENANKFEYGERLLRLENDYLEYLRKQAVHPVTQEDLSTLEQDLVSAQMKLNRKTKTIEGLQHEIESRKMRLINLHKLENPDSYNRTQHEDVLLRYIRDPNSVARLHPNLALAIYERIRISDIIFMLVGVNDAYRDWMSFESEVVTEMGKIAVLVRPDGATDPPPELLRYSRQKSWVETDGTAILETLRSVVVDLPMRGMRSGLAF